MDSAEQAEFDKLREELSKANAELQGFKKIAKPKDKEEVKDIKDNLDEIKDKLAKGEIKGMSESTAHALLDEIRALRGEIAGKKPDSQLVNNNESKPANSKPWYSAFFDLGD